MNWSQWPLALTIWLSAACVLAGLIGCFIDSGKGE